MKKSYKILSIIIATCLFINSLPINTTEAGQIGDWMKNTKSEYVPDIIKEDPFSRSAAEIAIKDVIKRFGKSLANAPKPDFSNVPGVVPPSPGMPNGYIPGAEKIWSIGFGKLVGSGMTLLSFADFVKSTWDIIYKKYDDKWTTKQIIIDKILSVADAGVGYVSVSLGMGALIGVIAVGPELAATMATLGLIKIGTSILKSAYNMSDAAWKKFAESIFGTNKEWNDWLRGLKSDPGLPPGVMIDTVNGIYTDPDVGKRGHISYGGMVNGGSLILPYDTGINGQRGEISNVNVTREAVLKPNIYLYSDEDKTLDVELYYEESITASIPKYVPQKGWNANIKNGSLNGDEGFLFYEAMLPNSYYQKNTGWLVRGENMRADILLILDQYGFSKKEKQDFLEYWVPKLDYSKNYIFYNQDTRIVNMVIPISITPELKNSYRIWFYIKEYSGESYTIPQNIDRITDRSDTVVEWGGILGK